ncbi:MAG: NnrU family protein [Burkholderiaceae bacterium]|nr:NnrU family protein [Burkholderiaceae bacterium]
MYLLIAGLIIFLSLHSVRIVADGWRTRKLAQWGEGAWKGVFSAVSIAGFGLICWGYGQARLVPVVLWVPPVAMRHIAAGLMLLSLILLVAAYVPGNAIKAKLHHPMVLGVKTWATAHLLANGNLADVLLFGSFLLWAVACFIAARKRDRAAGTVYPAGKAMPTVITVVLGLAVYGGFVVYLHKWLIGVPVFG